MKHQLIADKGIYFITFTCHNWLPLIDLSCGYDMVYNWFQYLEKCGNHVTGFVIMPNHIHLLLYYANLEKSLNRFVGNGKRFMAYEIVKRLKNSNHHKVLYNLANAVSDYDLIQGKKHEIWKDSFDVKWCRTEKFILQKLSYMHRNPCAGKWQLARNILEYPHSSAGFYISGRKPVCAIRDYRELLIEAD